MAAKKPANDVVDGEIVNETSAEVERYNQTADMLYGGMSYDDIISSRDVDVLPGWTLIEHKKELIGQPFAVVRATFRPSDISGTPEYVSVSAISKDLGAIVFNDGSTGIRAQVMAYCIAKGIAVPLVKNANEFSGAEDFDWKPPANATYVKENGKHAGALTIDVVFERPIACPRGLRASEYTYTDPETKKETPATTFYLG